MEEECNCSIRYKDNGKVSIVFDKNFDSVMTSELGGFSQSCLGNCSWVLFHNYANVLSGNIDEKMQKQYRHFYKNCLLFFPCLECRCHFAKKPKYPVDSFDTGERIRIWVCKLHKHVNQNLGKVHLYCECALNIDTPSKNLLKSNSEPETLRKCWWVFLYCLAGCFGDYGSCEYSPKGMMSNLQYEIKSTSQLLNLLVELMPDEEFKTFARSHINSLIQKLPSFDYESFTKWVCEFYKQSVF